MNADRVYRALLRAFTVSTRAQHGDAMAAHFARARRAAAGRPLAQARLWMAAVHDALWHGALDRAGVTPSLTTTPWRDRMQNVLDVFRAVPGLFSRDAGHDVRLALRRFVKAPGFTLVALLTIALGIGATSAIFTVVNAVLLTPLPFPQPDRLVGVFQVWKGERAVFTPPNFLDLQAQTKTLAASAAYTDMGMTLTGAGDPLRLRAIEVTAGFFDVLQTAPLHGRTLLRDDNTPGKHHVVVLSHSLWRSRFGGRPGVVGERVTLDATPRTVVGVMPEGFLWPLNAELWVPAEYDENYTKTNRGAWYLDAIARLAPGVSLEASQAEIATIGRQLEQQFPEANKDLGMTTYPLLDSIVEESRTALMVLLGAVGVVLLIACANVANLMLARAASRDNEFAVRAALGAGRARLIRQLLIESLLLAGLGAVLGLALSEAGLRVLLALKPTGIPRISTISINTTVVWVTAAMAMGTGLLFGLVPALHASRVTLTDSLRERGRAASGAGGRRTRAALVVAEMSLAVLLLVGAGLLIRSFARLTNVDPGFDPSNAVTFAVGLPESTYDTDAKRTVFYDRVRSELASLPGAAGVAAVLTVPPNATQFSLTFSVKGRPPKPPGQQDAFEVRVADHNYFRLMGIPVTRGRAFTADDRAGSPQVALLTESAVRRHFAGEDPIGKFIEVGWRRNDSRVAGEVVGIVSDVKSHGLDQDAPAQIYFPVAQVPTESMAFVMRTATAPESMLQAARAAVGRVDSALPVNRLETLEEHVAASVAQRRFFMLLLVTFASVALILAAIGIFGVLSYLVAQRTREIGIRVALGARRGTVIAMVLRQALSSAGLGVTIGILAAMGLSRYMKTMLFDLTPTDPLTFTVVGATLLGVALVAAWIPARRAVTVDPTSALRD
jgi:putative ABC transport system permease protein